MGNNPQQRLGAVAAIAAALAIALLAGCSPKPGKEAPAPGGVALTAAQRRHIRYYTVTPSTFHKTIIANGVVDFDNDQATSVIAPFSGPVARLLVPLGQRVRQGEALAIVDSSDFAAAVGAYRKTLAAARAARRLADLDKDLLQHHGISQREEEQAESDAVGAEADRDAARQALVALNVDPRIIKDILTGRPVPHLQGTIRSPIAGTVVEKLITPGELLSAGTTACFTVADLSRVWVMAQVFGDDVASVAQGDTAEIETGISKDVGGTVGNVSAVVNPDTRSVAVRIVADNPGDLLKKQMYVRVRIRSAQPSTGLLVPSSAIVRDSENLPFVYVAERDSRFFRRHVMLGYRDGDRYDITSGLKPGDRIVSDGALFLQFMQNQ